MKPAKRIVTVADPSSTVVVFSKLDGSAEAVVTKGSSAPTVVLIDPPPEGQRIVTTRHPDGTVEVMYRSMP